MGLNCVLKLTQFYWNVHAQNIAGRKVTVSRFILVSNYSVEGVNPSLPILSTVYTMNTIINRIINIT